VPVIIMTGMALGKEWAREHGCAGFLKKPIDKFALLEQVGRCLVGRGNEAPVVAAIGVQPPAPIGRVGAGSRSH
jgi:hypothetical protein